MLITCERPRWSCSNTSALVVKGAHACSVTGTAETRSLRAIASDAPLSAAGRATFTSFNMRLAFGQMLFDQSRKSRISDGYGRGVEQERV